MEIPEPLDNQFTIYSKSGCPNCTNVKRLLKDKLINFTVIDCDEFILENKDEFLHFIQQISGKECKQFPIVFDNKKFVGGFNDTITYIEKLLYFDDAF